MRWNTRPGSSRHQFLRVQAHVLLAPAPCGSSRSARLLPTCYRREGFRFRYHKRETQIVCSHAPLNAVCATYASSKERHAILHDFCMIIPYSTIVLIAGAVSIPFGNGWKGLLLAAFGALQLYLTLQSLRRWREGKRHRFFTATTAGFAGMFMRHFWGNSQRGLAIWPNRLMAVLSAAATVFLIYNVLAGGNPPREDPAVTATESTVPEKSY